MYIVTNLNLNATFPFCNKEKIVNCILLNNNCIAAPIAFARVREFLEELSGSSSNIDETIVLLTAFVILRNDDDYITCVSIVPH